MILKDYENFSGLKSVHAMCGRRMEDYEKKNFRRTHKSENVRCATKNFYVRRRGTKIKTLCAICVFFCLL